MWSVVTNWLRRCWRNERGSQGTSAAAAGLAAGLIAAALLVGARGTVAPAVEHAMDCAAAVLSGGGGTCQPAAGTAAGNEQAADGATQDFVDGLQRFFADVQHGNIGWLAQQLWGVLKGFGLGAWDMLTGAKDLVADIWGLVTGDADVRAKYANLLQAFHDHPLAMLKAMGQGVIAPIQAARARGDYGEAAGRVLFELVSTVVGDKGIGKAAKAGASVDEILDVARAAEHADDVLDLARGVEHADEVGDAAGALRRLPCVGLVAPRHKLPGLGAPLAGCGDVDIGEWLDSLPRKETPNNTLRDAFEIKHTGPDNIQLQGGGERIWADGVRQADGFALESKFIDNPASSPFIANSKAPDFIRAKVVAEVDNEFRRYAAIIHDAQTPVRGLEVITNDTRAVSFFEDLLRKYNIPGRVVVKD